MSFGFMASDRAIATALLLAARELRRHLLRLVRHADAVEELHGLASASLRDIRCTVIGPSVTFSSTVLWRTG
jgi:hypothetical protein